MSVDLCADVNQWFWDILQAIQVSVSLFSFQFQVSASCSCRSSEYEIKFYKNFKYHLHNKSNKVTLYCVYRQVSNISRTLVGNRIVDNSDVVAASPVGAAPITSSLST